MPGIISSIVKILQESYILNSKIIVNGLAVLETLLSLVFRIQHTVGFTSDSLISAPSELSMEWSDNTLPKIETALSLIFFHRLHDTISVKIALMSLSRTFLPLVPSKYSSLRTALLETFLFYQISLDTRPESIKCLVSLTICDEQRLILVNKATNLIKTLPNLIKKNDKYLIDLLLGYIMFLKDTSAQISTSKVLSICKCALIDTRIVSEDSYGNIIYSFQHGHIMESIRLFWRLCGRFMNAIQVLESIITTIEVEISSEQVWTANEIVIGFQCVGLEDFVSDHKEITAKYTGILNRLSSVYMRYLESIEVTSATKIVISLCLEGVERISLVLGQDLNDILEDGLLIILQLAGNEDIQISKSARISLSRISDNLGFSSESELIVENFDYLISTIGIRLQVLEKNTRIAQVLYAAVKIVGIKCQPFANNIVEDLMDALDESDTVEGNVCISIARALSAFVEISAEDDDRNNAVKIPLVPNPINELRHYILERKRNQLDEDRITKSKSIKEIENYFTDKEKDFKSVEKSPEVADEPSSLNESQSLTMSILSRMQYFINSDSPQLRKIIIGIVTSAVKSLQNVSTSLHPLIHSIWPMIISRLNDKEFYITIQTLELISELAKYAPTFLTRRVIDDLWPLIQRLSVSIKSSTLETTQKTVFLYSVEFKLQKAYLECIQCLVSNVKLNTVIIQTVSEMMWDFLNKSLYPVELQNLALKCIQSASSVNGDYTLILKKVSLNER